MGTQIEPVIAQPGDPVHKVLSLGDERVAEHTSHGLLLPCESWRGQAAGSFGSFSTFVKMEWHIGLFDFDFLDG